MPTPAYGRRTPSSGPARDDWAGSADTGLWASPLPRLQRPASHRPDDRPCSGASAPDDRWQAAMRRLHALREATQRRGGSPAPRSPAPRSPLWAGSEGRSPASARHRPAVTPPPATPLRSFSGAAGSSPAEFTPAYSTPAHSSSPRAGPHGSATPGSWCMRGGNARHDQHERQRSDGWGDSDGLESAMHRTDGHSPEQRALSRTEQHRRAEPAARFQTGYFPEPAAHREPRTISEPRRVEAAHPRAESEPTGGRASLPEGWSEEYDRSSSHVFYHNYNTGVSQWEPPRSVSPPPVPPPVLSTHPAKPARLRRQPSMDWASLAQTIIEPQLPQDRGKYVVVLDLDETLVYAREGPLVVRPGAVDLLALLSETVEIVLWTAGERAYAQSVLREIDTRSAVRHCVYRHHKWFDGNPGQLKDLRLLGRDLSRTLVVENTPDCVRRQAANAVLVPDYHGAAEDATLPRLGELIRCLVESGLPVDDFLWRTQLVSLRPIRTDVGDTLNIHCLGDVSSRGPNLDMNGHGP
eukprot:TRINITY_DN9298_c0_g1_i1.p1 TRINITY_DN9298_c0_g1~~TRINITY_DN9298_c0_g1_i1.p1  ORF type:complete len:523 (+),score=105.30 TRINITY_DN9298_c0_g1_i1:70-1638(+)